MYPFEFSVESLDNYGLVEICCLFQYVTFFFIAGNFTFTKFKKKIEQFLQIGSIGHLAQKVSCSKHVCDHSAAFAREIARLNLFCDFGRQYH